MTTPTQPQPWHRNADTPTPTPRTDAMVLSNTDTVIASLAILPVVRADFARYLERELAELSRHESAELASYKRECDALRSEYESRAIWIAKMNKILGYDNTDGFHSEPDPHTIAQNLAQENAALRKRVEEMEAEVVKLTEVDFKNAALIDKLQEDRDCAKGEVTLKGAACATLRDQIITARRELAEAQTIIADLRSFRSGATAEEDKATVIMHLRHQLAGLNKDHGNLEQQYSKTCAQLAEAAKDREDLDWVQANGADIDFDEGTFVVYTHDASLGSGASKGAFKTVRAAIRAARTSTQPKETP